MTEKDLICIGCPLGCPIHVKMNGKEVTEITGYTCKRGEAYAQKEMTHPTRIVTSTVKVSGGVSPMVSVKTATDIPKDKIFDCVKALQNIIVSAPVHIGDVVVADAAGTGVSVIATKNVD